MRLLLLLVLAFRVSFPASVADAGSVQLGRSDPGRGFLIDYQVVEGIRLYYLGMNDDGMAILATGEGLGTMRTEPSPFLIDQGDLFRLISEGFLNREEKVFWVEVVSFDEDSIHLRIRGP